MYAEVTKFREIVNDVILQWNYFCNKKTVISVHFKNRCCAVKYDLNRRITNNYLLLMPIYRRRKK